MSYRLFTPTLRWLLALLLVTSASAALAQSDQQKLVNAADTTFSNFMRDPDMAWLAQNIGRAKGVLIAPEVAKAGFIFGGSGLVSYSRSKGVYGGVNLDGTVVAVSKDWNEGFYQKPVTAPDILVRMTAHSKGADKLIGDISRAAGKR